MIRNFAAKDKQTPAMPAPAMPSPSISAAFSNLISTFPVVNGLKIHTRISRNQAPTAAMPVVLVHGLGASGRYMIPTAERLAPHHPVFVPDLPGFGASDKPPRALTVPEMADELIAWMSAIGLESAAFLGNSLGCQVIVDLAARYPAHVQRAILVGPTFDTVGRTMPRQILRGCRDLLGEPWSLWWILAGDYFITGTVRMIRVLRYALDDPIERKLHCVQAPTLVVRGSRDPIAPQRWIDEMVEALPAGRSATIPGGTHAANYSAPDQLVELVREFLKTSSDPPR